MAQKLLFINTYPNPINETVSRLIKSFIAGLEQSENSVEIINTASLEINSCRGCTEDYTFESPGRCHQDDDMQELYPKLREADVWIFATPHSKKSYNNSLKIFFDRLEPLFDTVFNLKNGTSNVVTPKQSRVLLLATSDDFDIACFDNLIEQVRNMCLLYNREYIGAVLRPHIWSLSAYDYIGKPVDTIYSNIESIAKEFSLSGELLPELLSEFDKELIPKDSFLSDIGSRLVSI